MSKTPPKPGTPDDGMEDYHRIADTVGGIPNLRGKDNLIQLAFATAGTGLGAGAGWMLDIGPRLNLSAQVGLVIGAFLGLIASVFLSGFVLMVIGWVRESKRRKAGRGR